MTIKTKLRRVLLAGLALIALASCGGGGGDEEGNEVPGSVTIETPTESPTYTTASESVVLAGSRFIPVVSVRWSNAAGGGGEASLSSQECYFFGAGPFTCNTRWASGSIPLVVGENVITVTATESDGEWGRDTITVVRRLETTPPRVSSTSPLAGAFDVAANTSVTANFSEEMSPASIATATFLLTDSNNNPISGTVTYSNGSATFTPVGMLAGATNFTATITTGATDLAGNALISPYIWTFLSSPLRDTTAPTVTSTSPPNSNSCAPVDTTIAAEFSESISGTQVSSGVLTVVDSGNDQVSGGVSFSTFTRLVFTPANSLASSSLYTATLTTAVKDASGNPMAANYSWAFTTAGQGVGTWQAISTTSVPTARSMHTAVWTGTEMIIWGGGSIIGGLEPDRTGARYNPVSDSWATTTNVGAPVGREGHVAVWTGNEMIIWGGRNPLSSSIFTNDGARYNPLTDTWSPISAVGAPLNRVGPSAVWTGTEMLVFGGGTGTDGSNARYNPATDSWAPMSAVSVPVGLSGQSAIWTGSRMIVWGGSPAWGADPRPVGGAYDPATNTWEATALVGAPSGRTGHTAVWTGSEMAVWGGEETSGLRVNSGGLYNPQTKTWRPMSTGCAPSARTGHNAVWNGSEMIVWGGLRQGSYFAHTGSRYDPIADAWEHMSIANVPVTSDTDTAVWTGTSMIVWHAGNRGTPMGMRYQP